jgi:branched-chain amino acid transport system permease protein
MSFAVVASTVSPAWAPMTFFVVLIVVLLIRPQGLLGTEVRGSA